VIELECASDTAPLFPCEAKDAAEIEIVTHPRTVTAVIRVAMRPCRRTRGAMG
jgi:hypothetical protein